MELFSNVAQDEPEEVSFDGALAEVRLEERGLGGRGRGGWSGAGAQGGH